MDFMEWTGLYKAFVYELSCSCTLSCYIKSNQNEMKCVYVYDVTYVFFQLLSLFVCVRFWVLGFGFFHHSCSFILSVIICSTEISKVYT